MVGRTLSEGDPTCSDVPWYLMDPGEASVMGSGQNCSQGPDGSRKATRLPDLKSSRSQNARQAKITVQLYPATRS